MPITRAGVATPDAASEEAELAAPELPLVSELLALEDDEETFKWKIATTSDEDLKRESTTIQRLIGDTYMPVLMQRAAEGEYEILKVGEDGLPVPYYIPPHLVVCFGTDEKGNHIRMTLPEAKYPEAYVLKRKAVWIEEILNERLRQRLGIDHR